MRRNNFEHIRKFLSFEDEGDFYLIQILKRRKDNPGLKGDTQVINNYFIYSLNMFDHYEKIMIGECEENNARAYIRINKRNDKIIAHHTLNAISNAILYGQHPTHKKIIFDYVNKDILSDVKRKSDHEIIADYCGEEFDESLLSIYEINANQKPYIHNLVSNVIDSIVRINKLDQSTLRKEFMSAAGKHNTDKNKKWLIDLDKEILEYEDFFIELITFLYKEQPESNNAKIYGIIETVSGKHIICSPFNLSKFNKEVTEKANLPITNLLQKDSPTLLYF